MSCCCAVGVELGIGCHNSACYRCGGFGVRLLHRRYCQLLGALNSRGNIANVRIFMRGDEIVVCNFLYCIKPTVFVIFNTLNVMPMDEYCLFFAYKTNGIDQLLGKCLTVLQGCVFPRVALIKRQQSLGIFYLVGFEQMGFGSIIGGVILTDDTDSFAKVGTANDFLRLCPTFDLPYLAAHKCTRGRFNGFVICNIGLCGTVATGKGLANGYVRKKSSVTVRCIQKDLRALAVPRGEITFSYAVFLPKAKFTVDIAVFLG